MIGTTATTMVAAFSASFVEFVEALTIVLAVGTTRGWTSALTGAGSAVVTLALLTVIFGPALAMIPVALFKTVVGGLLMLFGLRWLQKAILRSAGVLPLHDEGRAFRQSEARLVGAPGAKGTGPDWLGLTTAFKAVLIEGVEVVFIVLAIGSGPRLFGPAVGGAAIALLAVVALGLAVRRPLARVPENTLKFGVGLILTAFGIFWTGEGLGVAWVGGDLALFYLTAFFLVASLVFRNHARTSVVR